MSDNNSISEIDAFLNMSGGVFVLLSIAAISLTIACLCPIIFVIDLIDMHEAHWQLAQLCLFAFITGAAIVWVTPRWYVYVEEIEKKIEKKVAPTTFAPVEITPTEPKALKAKHIHKMQNFLCCDCFGQMIGSTLVDNEQDFLCIDCGSEFHLLLENGNTIVSGERISEKGPRQVPHERRRHYEG